MYSIEKISGFLFEAEMHLAVFMTRIFVVTCVREQLLHEGAYHAF